MVIFPSLLNTLCFSTIFFNKRKRKSVSADVYKGSIYALQKHAEQSWKSLKTPWRILRGLQFKENAPWIGIFSLRLRITVRRKWDTYSHFIRFEPNFSESLSNYYDKTFTIGFSGSKQITYWQFTFTTNRK